MLVTGTRPVEVDYPITLEFDVRYSDRLIKKLGLKHPNHRGIDFGTPPRVAVKAYRDGYIQIAKDGAEDPKGDDGFGKRIWLYCDLPGEKNGIRICYAHLSTMMVIAGQHVKEGQTIGYTGSTGKVDGPHLHMESHILPEELPFRPYFYGENPL